jgi:Ca2+-binding EF-hand superfamily protein
MIKQPLSRLVPVAIFSLLCSPLLCSPLLAQPGGDRGGFPGGDRGGFSGRGGFPGGGSPWGGSDRGGDRGGFSGRGGFPGGGSPWGGSDRGGDRGGFSGRGGFPGGGSPWEGSDRGGDQGGPSWGSRGGSDRGSDRGGFDPSGFLSRMDRNGNGKLDPDEMSDRMKQFMGPRLEAAGIDLSKSVDLTKITEAFRGGRSEEASREGGVPGFGAETEFTAVPGFDVEFGSALAAIGKLEERYDERILQRVDFTLNRYDSNKDGILDEREISRARWSGGSPRDNDLNKDGKLTRAELAERYVAREASEQQRGGDRERGGSSGDDFRSRWANASDEEREKMREEMRARFSGRGGPPGGDSRGDSRGDSQEDNRRPEEQSRERSSSTDSSSRSRSSSESRRTSVDNEANEKNLNNALESRYSKYVNSIFASKDENKDGKLDASEQESIKKLINVEEADSNSDGELTKDELLKAYLDRAKKSTSGSSSSSERKSSSSSDSKRLSFYQRTSIQAKLEDMGVDEDFINDDKNGDGQLQMSEFTTRWTQKKLEEFEEIDANGDGVISPKEWMDQ